MSYDPEWDLKSTVINGADMVFERRDFEVETDEPEQFAKKPSPVLYF